MSEEAQGQSAEKPREPNVRLAHNQKPVTVNGLVNIGATPGMVLPSEDEQKRGFWVSHPEVLITQYYPRYKYFKGTETSLHAEKQTVEEKSRDQQTLEAEGGDTHAEKV